MTGEPHQTYTHLAGRVLGLPYTEGGGEPGDGFDCAGLAMWVLRELGLDPPEGCLDGSGGECWERIGDTYMDATQAGDILVSDPSAPDETQVQAVPERPHVTVLVEPEGRMCLSAHVGGGVYGCKSFMVANVVGVYRLR